MVKNFFKTWVYPISTMAGSIIGVGFLSLPYIAQHAGMAVMLGCFVVTLTVVTWVHMLFAQVSLKTPDFKRWPGFVKFYLGSSVQGVILVTTILGSFGVLLIYLIVGSQFLSAVFGGATVKYAIVYFSLAALLIYIGAKTISKVDFLALLLLVCSFVLIFLKGFTHFSLGNFSLLNEGVGLSSFLLPSSALIFAFWGSGLIPEIEEMVGDKRSLKKIVAIGTIVPAIIYLIFIFLVVGITGNQTTESALVGVQQVLGDGIISIALLIGVVTTFIAFIAQGLLLKKTLMYDLGVKEFSAFLLVCFPPFALFLLGSRSFIPVISFIGGILLPIDALLILQMYKKIGGKKPTVYVLSAIFILIILYEVAYLFK